MITRPHRVTERVLKGLRGRLGGGRVTPGAEPDEELGGGELQPVAVDAAVENQLGRDQADSVFEHQRVGEVARRVGDEDD